ncbi:MAG: hypothetical protein R2815_04205 [Flavobacteriales bacterium]
MHGDQRTSDKSNTNASGPTAQNAERIGLWTGGVAAAGRMPWDDG